MTFAMFLLAAALGSASAPQPPPEPEHSSAIASLPKVELQGKIERVQVAPGGGAPYLEVKNGEKTTRVYLGSMRYLMEQNFNPKAGDDVSVSGYQRDTEVIASSVKLHGQEKALQLRDETGRPMWRGGRHGKGGQGGGPGKHGAKAPAEASR